MKQGWEIKTLGEVLQKTETVDPTKKPNLTFKYVDVSSVSNTTYTIDNYVEIYGKDAPSRARKLIKCGDVLFATVRPALKRIAIVPNALNGDVCSTGYFVLRPKKECYNRFIYFYLQSDQFIDYIKTKEKGASYPAVTDGDVKSVELMIPPIVEQERIVEVLDSAFAKIETLRANAEQNLENAKKLFQASLKQELTPKQGWETEKLGNIATIEYGYTEKSKSNGHFRYIRITDTNADGLLSDKEKVYIDSCDGIQNYILKNNDLLMARVGASFAKVLFFQSDEPCVFASYLIRIIFKNDIDNKFYWYFSKSFDYVTQANILSAGAAQPQFNGNALKQVSFSFPSVDEQQAIVEKLDALSERCRAMEENYRQTLTACKNLKQVLLKKAFNGEL